MRHKLISSTRKHFTRTHFEPTFWDLLALHSHFSSKNKLTCQYQLGSTHLVALESPGLAHRVQQLEKTRKYARNTLFIRPILNPGPG